MSTLIKDKNIVNFNNNKNRNIIINKLILALKNSKEGNEKKKYIPLSLNNANPFYLKNKNEKNENNENKNTEKNVNIEKSQNNEKNGKNE